MVKKVKKQTRKQKPVREPVQRDHIFFLKLVLYVILGAVWIKLAKPINLGPFIINGFPIGLIVGIIFASQDKFQIDRKIEYALLLMVAILTYFLPAGIIL